MAPAASCGQAMNTPAGVAFCVVVGLVLVGCVLFTVLSRGDLGP